MLYQIMLASNWRSDISASYTSSGVGVHFHPLHFRPAKA